MIFFVIFCLGLVIGSILNVVIHRLPLGQSVTFPPSHCPHCIHRLRWFELIPLGGYLFQGGKCQACGSAISIRYPRVEIMTGCLYVFLYIHFGLNYHLLVALSLISVLIPIVCIDLQHQLIPDALNLAGGVIALIALLWSDISFVSAASGFLIGGSILLLIAVISRGGMGGGDIKMMAMMGLFLGWRMTLLALFVSFIIGGVGSLIFILTGIKGRKDMIPFVPFLALGGFTAYVYGNEILIWYIRKAFM
jgi:leader peptidase (prepilin peptidase) / N-methyltransferase